MITRFKRAIGALIWNASWAWTERKTMIFNGSDKIKDDGGDYLVLTDYGCEGFAVTHQADTHEDALRWMTECNYGSPQTLVKLVRVDTRDVDLPNDQVEFQEGSAAE